MPTRRSRRRFWPSWRLQGVLQTFLAGRSCAPPGGSSAPIGSRPSCSRTACGERRLGLALIRDGHSCTRSTPCCATAAARRPSCSARCAPSRRSRPKGGGPGRGLRARRGRRTKRTRTPHRPWRTRIEAGRRGAPGGAGGRALPLARSAGPASRPTKRTRKPHRCWPDTARRRPAPARRLGAPGPAPEPLVLRVVGAFRDHRDAVAGAEDIHLELRAHVANLGLHHRQRQRLLQTKAVVAAGRAPDQVFPGEIGLLPSASASVTSASRW